MNKVLVVLPHKYKYYYEEELSLVKTIYKDIVDRIIVKKPNPKFYIPYNRIEKIKDMDIDKIIIMDRVKPTQIINITRETEKEVIDRVLLILEIFNLHAGSLEAKLQIEMAKLKHQLPLIKEAIRYAKLGELHGFLGAGRYGYEKYYTMMRMKEAKMRKKLEKLRKTRMLHRKQRTRLGYPHIAIIGYTCAGKTTLFNKLTKTNKPVGPEPFTTLSPKSKKIYLGDKEAIVTDTVGFIRDLPHEIIEAFYATLEEISNSDIIVHVIDISKDENSVYKEIIEARRILSKIGVHGKPVILALNKIDLLKDINGKIREISKYRASNEVIIPISALKDINIDLLKHVLKKILEGKEIGKDICSKVWA
ncbi:MAG: GTPase HflX [Desulfurococcales archaeon ex4484_58]|nr:MAG: GTPase HflX [Desulfurococcales archaeon ex4484_58]